MPPLPKIEKSQDRIKKNGEVFTPTSLAQQMLNKIPPQFWKNPDHTFLEPACGDGVFVTLIVKTKLLHKSSIQKAIQNTYALDIMPDNILHTRINLINLIHAFLSKQLLMNKISKQKFLTIFIDLASTVCYNVRKVKDSLSFDFDSFVPLYQKSPNFIENNKNNTIKFLKQHNLLPQ